MSHQVEHTFDVSVPPARAWRAFAVGDERAQWEELEYPSRPPGRGSIRAVAGSRRESDSVAWIGDSRDTRGQLFIAIWQHFLPQLAERVVDTNRAFKAFDARALEKILRGIQCYTFPYQIELLQACISHDIPLASCGIGYLDSEAASTQQGENITETY